MPFWNNGRVGHGTVAWAGVPDVTGLPYGTRAYTMRGCNNFRQDRIE